MTDLLARAFGPSLQDFSGIFTSSRKKLDPFVSVISFTDEQTDGWLDGRTVMDLCVQFIKDYIVALPLKRLKK